MLLTTSRSDGIDSSLVKLARRRPERDVIQSRCFAPPPHNKYRHGEMIQGCKDGKRTFCGHSLRDVNRITGTQPACDCTHFLNCHQKCPPTHATHQRQQQGTPNPTKQPQLTRALTCHAWQRWSHDLIRSRQPDEKCPSPMFVRMPTMSHHAPQIPNGSNSET